MSMALACACGPARILTRTDGDGGWSTARSAELIAARAAKASVDLDARPALPDDGAPLTLDEVQRLAATNRRVAEAGYDVASSGTRVDLARSRLYPTITGQGRYAWYTDPQATGVSFAPGLLPPGTTPPVVTIREQDFGTLNGTATLAIDLFGEITRSLTAAQAGYRAEEARRFSATLAEQVGATRAYFGLLEAERLEDVSRQTLAAQRQQLANADARVAAGRLTKNELLVVQVAVQSSEQALRQRELQTAQQRWTLNQTIGRPIDAATRVADVAARPVLPDVTTALRDAYRSNPALRALVEEQQRLQDTATSLARGRLPRLQGGGTIDYSTQDIIHPKDVGGAFVGFTWEITNGRREADIAQARIVAEQNLVRIERTLRDVELGVRSLHRSADERLAAIATAETAVRQAEENLAIRTQQFDVGRATSENVLDAEAMLAQQRAALASARYQAHVRRAELDQVIGRSLGRESEVVR
jgi:outer membrane protein TolC